jgi:hypothetical protein
MTREFSLEVGLFNSSVAEEAQNETLLTDSPQLLNCSLIPSFRTKLNMISARKGKYNDTLRDLAPRGGGQRYKQ